MDGALRELVRRRAGNRCEYCHLPQTFSELGFHIEHIRPRQHGGGEETKNLALACPECNLAKGPNLAAVDPDGRRIVRLFNPRYDKWTMHFSHHGPRIIGKTPIGRASVALLKMDDAERLRVRILLAEAGEELG
jgi:HNH endonuclease